MRRCTARRKNGEPCKGPAVRGTDKCRMHLGKKAAPVVAAHEALVELARRGVTPVDNPLFALAALAGEIVTVKDIFRDRVARLQEQAWRYQDDRGGEQLRAEIAMYERALDRSARVLADIARLKIDERLTAITEQQGQMLASVVVAVLERLDLGEQAGQVRELVAVELERLAA